MRQKQELHSELLTLLSAAISGLFPIIVSHTIKTFPPILFAGLSNLIPGLIAFLYIIFTKQNLNFFNKRSLKHLISIVIFIIVLPSFCIFLGAKYTSSINLAILLQTELLFTFIICGLFFKEKITLKNVLGAILIAIGTITVLYNGAFTLNKGDILIIIGTALYPIGNNSSKKALQFIPISFIVFFRGIFGGSILILISFLMEKTYLNLIPSIQNHLLPILINGILIFTIAKTISFYGLKYLDITRVIPLLCSAVGFSLIFAFLFLKEIPTFYQILGLIFIVSGIFVITKKIFFQTEFNLKKVEIKSKK